MGHAKYITARATFFLNSGHPTPLGSLRSLLQEKSPIENNTYYELLHKQLRTYHLDSVTPAVTDDDLPLVLSCETAPGGAHARERFADPPCMKIEFPPSVTTEWEGDSVVIVFEGREHPCPQRPYTVSYHLVDSVTFFSSGVLAYSIALLLHSNKLDKPFNAAEILSIFAETNTDGIFKSGQVTYHTPEFSELGLLALAKRRVATLRQRAALRPARTVNIFHLLGAADSWPDRNLSQAVAAVGEKLNAFASDTCFDSSPAPSKSGSARASVGTALSIEVLASERHRDIVELTASPDNLAFEKERNFLQCLSGLVQNVFDLRNQGDEEVRDSLSTNSRSGSDITFASEAVGVRFTDSDTRGYEVARLVVGSDPYWLLVHLVAGHNDFLLSELAKQMGAYREHFFSKVLLQQLAAGRMLQKRASREELRRLLERYKIREVASKYIDSPFKYDAEIADFNLITRESAVKVKRDRLREDDQNIEHSLDGAMKAALEFSKRRADICIALFLLAFGLLQVGGAMASLDAIWPDQGWKCVALSGCSRTSTVAPFSGTVFRAAFLLSAGGLLLSIAVAIAFFGPAIFSRAKAAIVSNARAQLSKLRRRVKRQY
jgi:hypothetical protein